VAGLAETSNCPTIGAEGQLFTRLLALIVPIPVAKSHPVLVPKAGWSAELDVESTPNVPDGEKQLISLPEPKLGEQGTSMSPSVTS
jgi:hypothetical protein